MGGRPIDDDIIAQVVAKAGVNFDPEGMDGLLVEDALSEALSNFYAQRERR